MPKIKGDKKFFELDFAGFAFFFNRRYRLIATLNDLALGIWFTIGSVLFLFSGVAQTTGTILFILGSAQLLGRPILKIMHSFSIRQEASGHRMKQEPSEKGDLK